MTEKELDQIREKIDAAALPVCSASWATSAHRSDRDMGRYKFRTVMGERVEQFVMFDFGRALTDCELGVLIDIMWPYPYVISGVNDTARPVTEHATNSFDEVCLQDESITQSLIARQAPDPYLLTRIVASLLRKHPDVAKEFGIEVGA